MTWFAAPLALAVAVAVTSAPMPRLTHAEGDVSSSSTGVRTAAGRAEIALPDGSLVHVDTSTVLSYPPDANLRLGDGRVVVRAAGAVDVETPAARLDLDARTVAIVLVDRAADRLLVSVPVGAASLRTRYASTTRVVSGQSAMMTSATAVPWATAYTRVQVDGFTLWSDARVAATGAGVAAADWAASDLSGIRPGATPPCTGYPSWTAPCWVLPAGPPPRPHPNGPPPSYAPNFTPNYAPNFNTRPPTPPATPGSSGSPHQPPASPPPPATSTPAPTSQPAPPPTRGNSGAVRVPERRPGP